MEFALKNKQNMLNHDVWQLPPQFISRIGELSQATLKIGLFETVGNAPKMIWRLRNLCGVSPLNICRNPSRTASQIPKGVEYKILSPQPPAKLSNLENRTLTYSPVILALTENEAILCFRFVDGRMDYASFSGSDPAFLNWVRDLFLYYWIMQKKV